MTNPGPHRILKASVLLAALLALLPAPAQARAPLPGPLEVSQRVINLYAQRGAEEMVYQHLKDRNYGLACITWRQMISIPQERPFNASEAAIAGPPRSFARLGNRACNPSLD